MENLKTSNEELLSVKDLFVRYETKDEKVYAVNGVSFNLNYGETLGLVGETGAGKTTIAKSILRILPGKISKMNGEIKVDDKIVTDSNIKDFRGKRISMVFQDPMTALNPVKRVGWQVAEGIRYHEKVSQKEANKRAKEMLEMVGISEDRFMEYPHQFSGGMKQRVVLAIALACNPDLLIADEPTSALDVTIQAQVLEMIEELQRRKNTAMILITHDFGVVAKSCDKVGIVYAGEIVEYGTIRQILKEPKHPYTQGLLNAIPDISKKVNRLNPIFGAPPDPTNLPNGCKFASRCPFAEPKCSNKVPMHTFADKHQCLCWQYSDEQGGEQK